jgi:predicted TIM-barrel fold metal-dependent hydrolase
MTTSRRGFLGTLAAGAMVGAGRAQAARAKGGPYVDVHTHIGRTWTKDPALSAEALVAWMDEHHVSKAVVLPLVSPESSSYLNLTEQALEAAHRFPTRLVPFCCIDPRTSYTGGKTGLRSMLQEWKDAGAKGFGEHKAGLPIADPKMMALYELCEELQLPVLFHCDDLRGTDKPGLPGLESALKAFPKLPFLGHGPGFWASIAGDATNLGAYPKGKVAPGGALDRLFDAYPNLHGDLSAGSGANAIGRDLEFGRAFCVRRADRLLFGTDYLKPGQPVPQFALFEGQLDLPPDVRAKIERENATRLLKLDA